MRPQPLLVWDSLSIPTFLPLLLLAVLYRSTPSQLLDIVSFDTAGEQPWRSVQVAFYVVFVIALLIYVTQWNRLRLVNLYVIEELRGDLAGGSVPRIEAGAGVSQGALTDDGNWRCIFHLCRLRPKMVAVGSNTLYRCLLLSLWFWTAVPVFIAYLWHFLASESSTAFPETAPLVGVTATLMLGVLLIFTISIFALGGPMRVSLGSRYFVLTPIVAVAARMFVGREFVELSSPFIVAGTALAVAVALLQRSKGGLSKARSAVGIVVPAALFLFSGFEPGKEVANGAPDKFRAEGVVRDIAFQQPAVVAGREVPVTFLSFGGGGSRAALYSAGILSKLWWMNERLSLGWTTSNAPSVEDTREFIRALRVSHPSVAEIVQPKGTDTIYPGRLILIFANALSTVSGGSLSGAYFVQRLSELGQVVSQDGSAFDRRAKALRAFFDPREEERLGNAKSPVAVMRARSGDATPPKSKSLQPMFERGWVLGERGWLYRSTFEEEVDPRTLTPDPERSARVAGLMSGFNLDESANRLDAFRNLCEQNAFIDRMNLNHLAAVLTGFFDPKSGRSQALRDFWDDRMGWRELGSNGRGDRVRLNDLAASEETGLIPHLVVNSTIAETGGRLTITNLNHGVFNHSTSLGFTRRTVLEQESGRQDLGPEIDLPTALHANEHDTKRNRLHRFSPPQGYVSTLKNLDPTWNIPLSQAVATSSAFTIGFPLVSVRDEFNQMWHLTDGGVCDNWGLDSVMAMVRSLRGAPLRKAFILCLDTAQMPVDAGDVNNFLLHWDLGSKAIWRSRVFAEQTLMVQYLRDFRQRMAPTTEPLWPDAFRLEQNGITKPSSEEVANAPSDGGPVTVTTPGWGFDRNRQITTLNVSSVFAESNLDGFATGLMADSSAVSPLDASASGPDAQMARDAEGPPFKLAINPTLQRSPSNLGQAYIAGHFGRNYGFYRVQMGEYAQDFVPTSWHLMPEHRRCIYRELGSQECTESLRRAYLGYLRLLIAEPPTLPGITPPRAGAVGLPNG